MKRYYYLKHLKTGEFNNIIKTYHFFHVNSVVFLKVIACTIFFRSVFTCQKNLLKNMNKYEYWSTHLLGVEMHIIYGYALLLLNRPFLYLCSNVIPYPIWIFTHILLPTWSHQLFELVVTGRQRVSDPPVLWQMNYEGWFFILFGSFASSGPCDI